MSDQSYDPGPTFMQPDQFGMINYNIPDGIQSGLIQDRIYLSTLQGGKIIIDDIVKAVWLAADHRSFDELINTPFDRLNPDEIRSVLACLVQAGVLTRADASPQTIPSKVEGKLVSAVIVAFNGKDWLPDCLSSLKSQNYSPIEIIVVDNFSTDHSVDWVKENYPEVKILQMSQAFPLSKAINDGVAAASGEYYFVLNQDIRIETETVAEMVAIAQAHSNNGAVASKLKFMWAPAFLNGLGNWVGDHSWGSDIGLGNLDFGQFDRWEDVPSACFAATLIPSSVWSQVGPIDQGFPMYYEDSDWCYRARLSGYKIYAAPKGVIYHAFGGKVPSGKQGGISAGKQSRVSYGRIRFAFKIAETSHLLQMLKNYLLEDWANFFASLLRGRLPIATAYLTAWGWLIRDLPGIIKLRKQLQSQRKVSDQGLFARIPDLPEILEWNGLPLLTQDVIKRIYKPLFRFDRTISMPEFTTPHRRRQLLIISSEGAETYPSEIMKLFTDMGLSLNSDLDVTLAIPGEITAFPQAPGIRVISYDAERPLGLQILVENHDIALIPELFIRKYPFLKTTKTRLVVNLLTSMHLDCLDAINDRYRSDSIITGPIDHEVINDIARAGDFFICGSERQRDQWLGLLVANGRFSQDHLAQDGRPNLLISIVQYNDSGTEIQIDQFRKYCMDCDFTSDRQMRFKKHLALQAEQNPNVPPMGKIEETLYLWRTQGFAKMTTQIFTHLRWIFLHR